MAKLALSRDMLTDFARLEKRAQARVSELADKFQRMSPQDLRSAKGIHLEPYTNGRDPGEDHPYRWQPSRCGHRRR
ncbi:MAG: hypothetical protein R2749_17570 [Acidimicrobiales bacterium]